MTALPSVFPTEFDGRYTLRRILGRGGMATVYLADDQVEQRTVALKVIAVDDTDPAIAERFAREVRAVGSLAHPGVLPLLHSGHTAEHLYFAMPVVEGASLRELLQREKQLSVTEAVRYAGEIAEALEHAHRRGVVHRDVKPENVMLIDGHAVLMDFGIARRLSTESPRITASGMLIGTPHYMCPEQVDSAREPDARGDIYSLGCLTYEMLAGQPPFTGATTQAILARHAVDRASPLRVIRPELPPHVEAAVMGALEKVPAERFASAAEFAAALRGERRANDERRKWPRLSTARVAIAALVLLALTVAFIGARLMNATVGKSQPDLSLARVSKSSPASLRTTVVQEVAAMPPSPTAKPSADTQANDLYLRGKVHLQRENGDDIAQAITLLEGAVRRDPNFPAALAALAHAYALHVFYYAPNDSASAERGHVAAEHALQLDPNLAEAHYARAFLLWSPRDHFPHAQAIKGYQRAVALDPRNDDLHHQLGLVFMHVGLLDSAEHQIALALELNPANRLAQFRVGVVQAYRLDYAGALETFRNIPSAFNPTLWRKNVAWMQLRTGDTSGARKTLDEFASSGIRDLGGLVVSTRAMLDAQRGDRAAVDLDAAKAKELGKGFGHFHHAAYNVGSAYAMLGSARDAVPWLEQAADDGFPCYELFLRDPSLDPIRKDPAFVALIERMKRQYEALMRGSDA